MNKDRDKNVLDIITIEKIRDLRCAGYVVVHRNPTERMIKESVRHEWPEDLSQEKNWHRMVDVSIKTQDDELNKLNKLSC